MPKIQNYCSCYKIKFLINMPAETERAQKLGYYSSSQDLQSDVFLCLACQPLSHVAHMMQCTILSFVRTLIFSFMGKPNPLSCIIDNLIPNVSTQKINIYNYSFLIIPFDLQAEPLSIDRANHC